MNELNNLTEFIDNHRPVIVSKLSEQQDNPIFDLKLDELIDFYTNLDYNDKVCMFESNLNYDSLFDLISQIKTQNLPFFAHYENCGYSLIKKIRKFYLVPHFMPMMLEFTRENWFILSLNNYKSNNFKRVCY